MDQTDQILCEMSELLGALDARKMTTHLSKADIQYATILMRIEETMENQPAHVIAAMKEVQTAARLIHEIPEDESDEVRMALFMKAQSHMSLARDLAERKVVAGS
jgi:hypothetical protein